MKMTDLTFCIYDFEVLAHDYLCVILNVQTGEISRFWNEDDTFLEFVFDTHEDDVFVGFNSKHYDQYILKAIAAGCSPEEVKEVNDWIIAGNAPWGHPYLENVYYPTYQCDLMDDCEVGMSLKSFEGHMGMNICESSVSFDIDRPLTTEERAEVENYCIHDVKATEVLFHLREGYLTTKMNLAERAGISPKEALGLTNAKLTAKVLSAVAGGIPDDERQYVFPDNLHTAYIPMVAIDFFYQMYDESISDDMLWSSQLDLTVGTCPTTLRWGGIHGAIPKFKAETTDEYVLINADVSSYYPSLMVYNGYTSRAMPSADTYSSIYHERLAAKAAGDKDTATSLKLIVNTAYGAMLNQYNPLYDPLNARSVCISGQLYLLELTSRLVKDIPSIDIVQLNTDGILVGISTNDVNKFHEICQEWQDRTHFGLEFDEIERIWQKDVNNYAMRLKNGKEKVKGGYLVRGASTANAFKINNNATIIADALKNYLLDDTPVDVTISECMDPAAFQMIAKASHKYHEVYQLIDGEKTPAQMCNRVFATTDERFGKLYKVKAENGQVAKIESLPENCLVSNEGYPSIDQIDKNWYIELAQKRAKDFGGNMAATAKTSSDTSKMNIYQKLTAARKMFLDANPKKSGVNSIQEYDYFELSDIVPIQTKIFAELGLFEQFWYQPSEFIGTVPDKDGNVKPVFSEALARCNVTNCDDPSDYITFQLKWGNVPPIFNKNGKEVNTEIQRIGGEQTYMRRYLKMQVLDIVEPDDVDREPAKVPESPKEKPEKAAPSKPPVASERAALTDKIADSDGDATQLQIRQLKKSIKTMVDTYGEAHPEVTQYVSELSLSTEKLTKISKKQCEQAIQHLGNLKAEYEKGQQ